MSALAWFRSDLRVTDNAALAAACAGGGPVAGVFLVADAEWRGHHWGPRRVRFVWEHALALREALAARGIPLHILHAPRFADAPAALAALARRTGARRIHTQAEYGVDERRRDEAVAASLAAHGIDLDLRHDLTLLAPGSVLTREGAPFRVFTPFRRSWLQQARTLSLRCRPLPPARPAIAPPALPAWQPPAAPADAARWPVGEQAAAERHCAASSTSASTATAPSATCPRWTPPPASPPTWPVAPSPFASASPRRSRTTTVSGTAAARACSAGCRNWCGASSTPTCWSRFRA